MAMWLKRARQLEGEYNRCYNNFADELYINDANPETSASKVQDEKVRSSQDIERR